MRICFATCVRRCFPIVRVRAQLTRTHYRLLVEKFRLRGIDCPEMNTAEGKAAKRFVDRLMSDAEEITVATSKVDKYDRYLADVYLRLRSGKEVFLNNALLENGHAVRMDGADQDDWNP